MGVLLFERGHPFGGCRIVLALSLFGIEPFVLLRNTCAGVLEPGVEFLAHGLSYLGLVGGEVALFLVSPGTLM